MEEAVNSIKGVVINLFRIKSLITLALVFGLVYLTITNGESTEYRTAFITAVGSVMTYYFTKKDVENNG